jgi:hypothetical protein
MDYTCGRLYIPTGDKTGQIADRCRIDNGTMLLLYPQAACQRYVSLLDKKSRMRKLDFF